MRNGKELSWASIISGDASLNEDLKPLTKYYLGDQAAAEAKAAAVANQAKAGA